MEDERQLFIRYKGIKDSYDWSENEQHKEMKGGYRIEIGEEF